MSSASSNDDTSSELYAVAAIAAADQEAQEALQRSVAIARKESKKQWSRFERSSIKRRDGEEERPVEEEDEEEETSEDEEEGSDDDVDDTWRHKSQSPCVSENTPKILKKAIEAQIILACCENDFGDFCFQQHNYQAAERHFQTALNALKYLRTALHEQFQSGTASGNITPPLSSSSPSSRYDYLSAIPLSNLGHALMHRQQWNRSALAFFQALSLLERKFGT